MNQDKSQVSQKITQDLLHEIREGCFKEATSLPPEIRLADMMGVSRNIIREALARLEREGWIARKHGVGTLINRHVTDAVTRLDLNYEFKKTLELSGHEVRIIHYPEEVVGGSDEICDKLGVSAGSELLKASRLFMADEKPAIYCVDYLPVEFIPEGRVGEVSSHESFFEFMNETCGIGVESSLAEIRASRISPEAARAMGLKECSVLLTMEEVSYDLHAVRVLYSESVFVDRMITHTIVRKKI